MNSFYYPSASGRIATILVGVAILLPYLLRRTRLSESLGLAQARAKPYLQRMRPHYWAGYLALGFSLMHAWIPMSAGRMPSASLTGLWLATLALCLLFFQLLLGLALRDAGPQRPLLRAIHFWSMLFIAGLVFSHVWLNSDLLFINSLHSKSWIFIHSFVL